MKYFLAVDIGASSGRHFITWKNENDELEYKEIKQNFYKLVNSEYYLLGNIYKNESLTNEYKKSFKLEEFIISELNKINN